MGHTERVERRDVTEIHSTRYVYEADREWNQYFCETPKAWELWGPTLDKNGLPIRLKRWEKKRIWFHSTK